jgi:hypothetical protein
MKSKIVLILSRFIAQVMRLPVSPVFYMLGRTIISWRVSCLALTIPVLFTSSTSAQGSSSDLSYAVQYTARVDASLGLSTNELEQIARTYGTVESLTFDSEANPCAPLKRDLVRRGEPGYAYPGFSVQVHNLFHRSEASGVAAFNPSAEDATTTINVNGIDIAVQWTAPKPGGTTARLSLTRGGQEVAWVDFRVLDNTKVQGFRPTFMRTSGIAGDSDIIQVFDYYEAPPPLEPITSDFPGVMSYTDLNAPPLQSNGLVAPDSTASVHFGPAIIGPNYNYDSGWLPDSDRTSNLFEIRISAGAAAQLSADVQGNIDLDNTIPSSPKLCLGSGSGYVGIDFGVYFSVQGSVYWDVWWAPTVNRTFNVPFIPNLDYSLHGHTPFSSFLLGSCAVATGDMPPQELFCVNFSPIPYVVDLAGCVDAGLEGTATLCGQSITLSDGGSFSSEGQCNPLTTCSDGYHVTATYNQSFEISGTVILVPRLHVGLLAGLIGFDIPIVHIPVHILTLPIDMPFVPAAVDFNDSIMPVPVDPTTASVSPSAACAGQSSVTLSAFGGSIGTYTWYAGGCGSGSPIGTGPLLNIPGPTSATTYYVRMEGSCGNTTCASTTLNITDTATAPTGATADINPACPGRSVTLSAVGGTGGTYTWYVGGCGSGAPIDTGSPITITAPSTPTMYYVRMEGDCGTTTCAQVTLDIVTSATPPSVATACPNPAAPGQSVGLMANGGAGGTYVWYAGGCGNGSRIGTGSPLVITAPGSPTTYYVRTEGACGGSPSVSSCASVTVNVDSTVSTPTITCPPDATVNCGDSTDPPATGTPTVTDLCDPSPVVTYTDSTGAAGCLASPVHQIILRLWTVTDRFGNSRSCTQHILVLKTQAKIDIKPGSCPNGFNPKQMGVVPVSIVGTPAIDATKIDPASVRISRADCVGASVAPLRSVITDVATPYSGAACGCNTLLGDGVRDLLVQFSSQAMVSGLQLADVTPGVPVPLVVTGMLSNGCHFVGSDCIVFRPGGR